MLGLIIIVVISIVLYSMSLRITNLKAQFESHTNVPALTQTHSLIYLTETGKKIAKEMDIEVRVSNNWDKICTYLDENLDSKYAYDIRQFCIEAASVVLDKFFSDEDVKFITNFAHTKDKSLSYYGSMIGIIICDAYFEHKGISIEDVE